MLRSQLQRIRFIRAQLAGPLHPGKTEVRIYDYVDRDVPMLARMFEKRLRGYRAIGYDRDSGTLPKHALDDAVETLDRPS